MSTYNLYIGATSKNCEAISLINVCNSNILISLSNLKRRDREGNFSLYPQKNGMEGKFLFLLSNILTENIISNFYS